MDLQRREFILELILVYSKRHLRKMVRNRLSRQRHNIPVLSQHIRDELVICADMLDQRLRLQQVLTLDRLFFSLFLLLLGCCGEQAGGVGLVGGGCGGGCRCHGYDLLRTTETELILKKVFQMIRYL